MNLKWAAPKASPSPRHWPYPPKPSFRTCARGGARNDIADERGEPDVGSYALELSQGLADESHRRDLCSAGRESAV